MRKAAVASSHVDQSRARLAAEIYSTSVLLALARRGASPVAAEVARELRIEARTYADLFEQAYEVLWQSYRSEYVYKNVIVNRILLGRHSLRTTRYLPELRVGDCKADAVLVNGTSTCYEIKTELDGLARLQRQLGMYLRAFDRVFVVTYPGLSAKVLADVPVEVGVIVLLDGRSLRTLREPESRRHLVDPLVIFDSLRRDEYTSILRSCRVDVPDVPNSRIYRECRALFARLTPQQAHDGMVRALKTRSVRPEVARLVEAAPQALRAAVLAADLSRRDAENLTRALTSEVIRS